MILIALYYPHKFLVIILEKQTTDCLDHCLLPKNEAYVQNFRKLYTTTFFSETKILFSVHSYDIFSFLIGKYERGYHPYRNVYGSGVKP